jgi:hypothetical protein
MSYLNLTKSAAPATPAAGKASIYVDTSGNVHVIDANGTDSVLTNNQERNYLRNSGFWFAQRQAPGTLTTYSSATNRLISADGWGITCENASAQFIRTDTSGAPEANLQSRYYGQFTKITSTGKLEITQCLEGVNAQALRGRTVRVQVKLRGLGAASALWNIALVQNTGTVDAPTAAFFSAQGANGTDPTLGASLAYIAPKATVTPDGASIVGNKLQATVTNGATWIRVGGCFDVPTTTKNLIVVIWSDSQVAATNGIAVAEATLVDGFEVQAWSQLPYEVELERVQRYYAKTFDVDTAPAAAVLAGALRCILGKAGAVALAAQFQWRFPVPLRSAAPTITTFNPVTGASAQVRQIGGTAGDLTATATANPCGSCIDITATGISTGAVGDQCGVQVTADAEL